MKLIMLPSYLSFKFQYYFINVLLKEGKIIQLQIKIEKVATIFICFRI